MPTKREINDQLKKLEKVKVKFEEMVEKERKHHDRLEKALKVLKAKKH